LDLIGQAAAGQGVVAPEAAVRQEEPGSPPPRRRAERLGVLARHVRAEGPQRRHSPTTTQTTWPVLIGWPAATVSSETRPARCAVISFSIFMASTTQRTCPASTSSPSATSTARTVPCIGLITASLPPANWLPPAARLRRRRASSA